MFIGRSSELKFLENKYKTDNGQLIVLYGRRRVGKTETLKKFCEGKPHVFFACRECTDKLQLKSFSEKMMKEDIPAKQYIDQFADWDKAFRAVLDLPYGDRKKLLVVDEFPYMCKDNSSIPSILQNLWDEILKDSNVMIILCGSAMSFIEKEVLAEKNPLYGRATGVYKMEAMNFYEAAEFFPEYSAKDKLTAYSILGGIPHYLKQFDPRQSLADNIKQNIFTKGCTLYSEVEFFLRQELRETSLYNSLLEAVALGNTRLNDISQKSLVEDTSKTSVYLRNLVQLGIVEREFSVDTASKEWGNRNRGIYKLADSFFRFWYAFAFTNYSALESGDAEGVCDFAVMPFIHEFSAFTFEEVCRQYIQELQKASVLPFRYARIGRFFGKTTVRDTQKESGLRVAETEIDILAISAQKKEYLVGECKLKNRPFSYGEYLNTVATLTPQKEQASFYYALFSESGFDDKVEKEAALDKHIRLFSLEDVVNCRI